MPRLECRRGNDRLVIARLRTACVGDRSASDERLWDDLVAREAQDVEGLQAVWTSPSFSHCVFTASKDFDKTLAARFTQMMLAMDGKDECSAEILRLEG